MTEQLEGQVNLFDPGTWSGKTSPEPSAVTEEKTSKPSSRKSQKSQSRNAPMFLYLTEGSGANQEPSLAWVQTDVLFPSATEYTTRSFGECPSVENASRLSQILEASPHPRYSLSAKACHGILNRAERRGKKLPEPLEAALRAQAGLSPSRSGGGKPGGGKGILIQREHVGALSTLNNQSVLQMEPILLESNQNHATVQTDGVSTALPASMGMGGGYVPMVTAYGFSSYDSNAMKSPNPHSGIYEADTARTLDLNGGNPACNQGGVAIVQSVGCDVYNQEVTGDVAASLAAASGGTNTSGPKVLCYENHSQDSRYKELGDVSETVSAKYGMGGNNQPLVLSIGNGQLNQMSMAKALCIGNGQADIASHTTEEVSQTLNCMHDPMAVLQYVPEVAHALRGKANCQFREDGETYITAVDCRNGVENENINGTLQAKSTGGIGVNFQNVCRVGAVVRRLTPLECERLQGYPDGWTNIGEWVDSKGKKHKDADSPRYKALGNSIALPFWQWMARRICAQYERTVTMGSLFDGIGGFPLAFQRCGAIPVWASEIEEFPIAVTKYHFPEEA